MMGALLHYGLAVLPVSVLAAFVLWLLPRMKGYSGRWRCAVWGLLAVRLLLPFRLIPEGMVSVPLPSAVTQAVAAAENWEAAAVTIGPLSEQEGGMPGLVSAAFCCLWPAGSGLYLLAHGVSYLHFRKRLKGKVRPLSPDKASLLWKAAGKSRTKPRAYVSAAVDTPLLYGLLRPRILLPDRDWAPEDLLWIFRHELTHWRRGDLWIKHLSLLVNAVFWWNPAAYWLRRQWNRDLELRCDEGVVRGLSPRERLRYGETLLRLRVPEKPVFSMAAGFGSRKNLLRLRVENLLDTGGRKRGILIFTLVLTGLLLSGSLLSVQAVQDILPASPEQGEAGYGEACDPEEEAVQWSWPLHEKGIRLTCGYGCRWGNRHNGLDLSVGGNAAGLPVYAAASGTVVAANQDAETGHGRYVVIYHGDNWYSLYAHCLDIQASVGQRVTAEDVIAHVGSTGNSTGPHLHFGIRHEMEFVDPLDCLPHRALRTSL